MDITFPISFPVSLKNPVKAEILEICVALLSSTCPGRPPTTRPRQAIRPQQASRKGQATARQATARQATRQGWPPRQATVAGHPQGVALLYTSVAGHRPAGHTPAARQVISPPQAIWPPQATRKGWPYYTRPWQATARQATATGHPQGVALLYTSVAGHRPAGHCDRPYARRPVGHIPAAGHTPAARQVISPPQAIWPRQATRKGWPYYTRRLQQPYIVGPPLAGGLPRWSAVRRAYELPCGVWPATVVCCAASV